MSYSGRVIDALTLSMELHHWQTRKGTSIPYVTHLWAVASLVGEYGGDENQVIAALLHDAIEDQGDKITFEQIQERFGTRVVDIVRGCTDAETMPKPPWEKRKQQYITHLTTAPPHVKLVSAADKLHNARAIVSDLRREGSAVWTRFNAGATEQVWYYEKLVVALRTKWSHRIVDELEQVVHELAQLAKKS
ncbi:MAG: HD domain-containing protein [Nitrospirae bacterium]|nr:HD domain-containing protein [Nitrospirota bacterium]